MRFNKKKLSKQDLFDLQNIDSDIHLFTNKILILQMDKAMILSKVRFNKENQKLEQELRQAGKKIQKLREDNYNIKNTLRNIIK